MVTEDNPPIFDDLMRFKPAGLTPNGWAVVAGVSRTVWADMRRHGNPSRRTLEKLLKAAGSSLAEFEALRLGPERADQVSGLAVSDRNAGSWSGPQVPGLSLLRTAMAGHWGDPADGIELMALHSAEWAGTVPRPASLARDRSAYAIKIVGESMWPRFRPGRIVAVSADLPTDAGDDVLVKLNGTIPGRTPVLVKELVSRTDQCVGLRQFNPDVTFEVAAREVVSIEKVLGEIV